MPPLTNRAQAAKARVLAEYASGNVGFHAKLLGDVSPEERRAIGKQADAELLARDAIIRQKDTKLEQQAMRIASLEAEVARLRARLDDARRTQP